MFLSFLTIAAFANLGADLLIVSVYKGAIGDGPNAAVTLLLSGGCWLCGYLETREVFFRGRKA